MVFSPVPESTVNSAASIAFLRRTYRLVTLLSWLSDRLLRISRTNKLVMVLTLPLHLLLYLLLRWLTTDLQRRQFHRPPASSAP